MNYRFGTACPPIGATVHGKVYIPSCVPGNAPLFNYIFEGEFVGECADGFMTRPSSRSDGDDDKSTIITRELWI